MRLKFDFDMESKLSFICFFLEIFNCKVLLLLCVLLMVMELTETNPILIQVLLQVHSWGPVEAFDCIANINR